MTAGVMGGQLQRSLAIRASRKMMVSGFIVMVSGGETVGEMTVGVMGNQLQRSLAIGASREMMVTGVMVTAALILTGAM